MIPEKHQRIVQDAGADRRFQFQHGFDVEAEKLHRADVGDTGVPVQKVPVIPHQVLISAPDLVRLGQEFFSQFAVFRITGRLMILNPAVDVVQKIGHRRIPLGRQSADGTLLGDFPIFRNNSPVNIEIEKQLAVGVQLVLIALILPAEPIDRGHLRYMLHPADAFVLIDLLNIKFVQNSVRSIQGKILPAHFLDELLILAGGIQHTDVIPEQCLHFDDLFQQGGFSAAHHAVYKAIVRKTLARLGKDVEIECSGGRRGTVVAGIRIGQIGEIEWIPISDHTARKNLTVPPVDQLLLFLIGEKHRLPFLLLLVKHHRAVVFCGFYCASNLDQPIFQIGQFFRRDVDTDCDIPQGFPLICHRVPQGFQLLIPPSGVHLIAVLVLCLKADSLFRE